VSGNNNQELFQNAYDLALQDKDRPVFIVIEPKDAREPWHIGVINPNMPMVNSDNYNATVPVIYTYVPVGKYVGSKALGYHADPTKVKSIEFFQYTGTVIEMNIDERWKENRK
jgi:hypothetical protein